MKFYVDEHIMRKAVDMVNQYDCSIIAYMMDSNEDKVRGIINDFFGEKQYGVLELDKDQITHLFSVMFANEHGCRRVIETHMMLNYKGIDITLEEMFSILLLVSLDNHEIGGYLFVNFGKFFSMVHKDFSKQYANGMREKDKNGHQYRG